jgi:hypothetical protein
MCLFLIVLGPDSPDIHSGPKLIILTILEHIIKHDSNLMTILVSIAVIENFQVFIASQ